MFSYSNALGRDRKKLGRTIAAVLAATLILSACDEQDNADQFLTRAQEYRDKGDLQASIIEAKNALRHNRDDQDARYILGSNYLDLGDWVSAETTLETALKQGGTLEYAIIPLLAQAKLSIGKLHDVLKIAGVKPDMSDELRARVLVVRGRAHSGFENHTEAKKSFNDALATDSKAHGAFLGLAGISIRNGDHKKGSELLAKAIEIAPDDIDVLEFQARYLFLKKEFAETEKLYRLLISKRPTRVAFHSGLINALIASEQLEQAIAALKPLLMQSPKNIQLNYLRALAAFRSKDFTTAYNVSSAVLGMHKGHIQSMLIAGASAFSRKEYGQAAQYLQQYVQANPSHDDARLLLSEVQLRQNRVSDATATLESVAKKQPDNVKILLAIGRARNMAGDLQKSGDYFQKAVQLDPENTRARAALGASQIALGRTNIGIEELKKAVEEDTNLSRAEIALILSLAGEKRYEEAIVAAKRLQKRHPKRPIGHTAEGLLQYSKGDPESAKAAFRKALEIKPDASDAASNLASIAIISKKPGEARQILQDTLKHRPNDIRLLKLLADSELRLRENDAAIKALGRILEIAPEELNSRLQLAQILLTMGRVNKAYLVIQSTPLIHQNRPGVLEVTGQTQIKLGLVRESYETFRALENVKPNSPHVKFLLAMSATALSQYAQAQKLLEEALSLDAKHVRSRMALADILLRRGDLKNAASAITSLSSSFPSRPEVLILQGRLALQEGMPEKAIKPLSEAQKVSGSSTLTSLLAMAQIRTKGRGIGLETLRQWLKKNPDDIKIRFLLANNYLSFEQYSEAQREFKILNEKQPQNWIFTNNLAESLNKAGKSSEALAYAEAAYKLAPTQPAVLDTYGVILLEAGDVSQALKILQTAARRAPGNAEISFNLARAYERSGKVDEARGLLQEILPMKKLFRNRKAAELLLKKLGG